MCYTQLKLSADVRKGNVYSRILHTESIIGRMKEMSLACGLFPSGVQKTEINDRKGSVALTTRHPSIRKSWH
jgi:hypothetical protein